MLINLDTWETEIGRIMISGQPRQVICETHPPPISKLIRAK
jgi:hypothetical protein